MQSYTKRGYPACWQEMAALMCSWSREVIELIFHLLAAPGRRGTDRLFVLAWAGQVAVELTGRVGVQVKAMKKPVYDRGKQYACDHEYNQAGV
jgi:hypothetical protein